MDENGVPFRSLYCSPKQGWDASGGTRRQRQDNYMIRPRRPRIVSSQGNTLTLNSGAQAFERLRAGNEAVLFMGLGPDLAVLNDLVGARARVFWCEHPSFLEQMEALRAGLPAQWQRVLPEDLASLPPQSDIFFYRQNTVLFPEFWGPLRARVLVRRPGLERQPRAKSILLPGDDASLLTRELDAAFTAEGFAVHRLHPAWTAEELPALLERERPALCLSVNLRGLDPDGGIFHLLRACEVPTAVWMVDNPWHLLSSLRSAWWTQAHICATDASFLPALQAAGAKNAFHLPLACSPEWARAAQSSDAGPANPLVFVGRSAFPDRRRFFAACRLPPETSAEAQALLERPGPVPDFHWWMRRLGIQTPWPGNDVRRAGLGAEDCSLARRAQWLKAALPHGLTVYGDAAWRALLPERADLRPPVDYYAALPGIYAQARYSLNVTSLLLPAGLNQRHFDVWIAGGFLLTDAAPGLDIFPAELRRECVLSHPGQLKEALARLENDAALRAQLQAAWKDCLLARHSYRHRAQELCERLSV